METTHAGNAERKKIKKLMLGSIASSSDQGPLFVTLSTLTQTSKLLWVGPAQNPLSMVSPDFYYISQFTYNE